MNSLTLDAICSTIRDNLIDPTDLQVTHRGGPATDSNTTLILTHNIQYRCMLLHDGSGVIVTVRGVDCFVSTPTQVQDIASSILQDYQQQLDELDSTTDLVQSRSEKRPPTLTLDLTGLSPDQVARILIITKE